jgi:cytochrome b
MRVWDLPVRALHWALVAAVVLAWISTLGWGLAAAHEPAGFLVLAVLALRVVWGFTGSHHARFREFVRPPSKVIDYARLWWRRREPRYVGHNPLGGWMIMLLLGSTAAAAITGALLITDRFWGSEILSTVHEALSWLVLVLIFLHVVGVVVTGRRHKENLVLGMFTGHKRSDERNPL